MLILEVNCVAFMDKIPTARYAQFVSSFEPVLFGADNDVNLEYKFCIDLNELQGSFNTESG